MNKEHYEEPCGRCTNYLYCKSLFGKEKTYWINIKEGKIYYSEPQ